MVSWASSLIVAFALLIGGAVYVRFRWYRSPQAYRAMIGLGTCYFVAGSLLGAWALHVAAPRPVQVAATSPSIASLAPPVSPTSAAAQPLNPPNKFSAKVTNITDGDTVDVLGSDNATYAIRLAGIDAPEHGQALGTQSTRNLTSLISDEMIAGAATTEPRGKVKHGSFRISDEHFQSASGGL